MSPRHLGSAAAPVGVPESAEQLYMAGRGLVQIARDTGLTKHQVRTMCRLGRWPARRRLARDIVEMEKARAAAGSAAAALLRVISDQADAPTLAAAARRAGILAHRLAASAFLVELSETDAGPARHDQ